MARAPSSSISSICCNFSLFFHLIIRIPYGQQTFLRTPLEKSLRFSSDSSFKIALFADLHYGENAWTDWGPRQDINSDGVMSFVLDTEKPDFVIFLGDVITANNLPIANASSYWNQAISPTRKRGIPWASVFGNHDDAPFVWPSEWFSPTGIPHLRCPPTNSSFPGEEMCSFKGTRRVELMEDEIEKNLLSHSRNGPVDLCPSVSNYVLQVSSSENPNLAVAFLYFLDSGGGSYPEVISNAQARWFQQKSQEINPGSRVPELIFWHIPSKAYRKVAPIFGIRKPCVGSINKERVAAQEAEWGIIDVLLKRSSVKAVFVGHNHGLDWCCPYKKLWLCFARHTGYGGYGNWPRGARIIEMTQQPFSLKSWIRMEDGFKHTQSMGQSTPRSLVSQAYFDGLLANVRAGCEGKSFYTYDGFIRAAEMVTGFGTAGSDEVRRREVAAFLANVMHETGGLCYIKEISPRSDYCKSSTRWPCAAGKRYFGRGPLQITWNYNYIPAGRAIGFDGLNNPEIVEQNPMISFRTAFWFWMNNCHNAIISGRGFGATIRAINGGECNGRKPAPVQSRINYFRRFCGDFRVDPGPNLSC